MWEANYLKKHAKKNTYLYIFIYIYIYIYIENIDFYLKNEYRIEKNV